MQVATLFRETAKLLGASIDGVVMESSKYCLKPDASADEGYEMCLDAVMCGPRQDRYPHHYDPGMRHQPPPPHHQSQQMNHNHNHHQPPPPQHPSLPPHHHPHLSNSRPNSMNPNNMKLDQYGGSDPYSFVDEVPSMDFMCGGNSNNNVNGNQHQGNQPKKRGRRKKSELRAQDSNDPMSKGMDEKLEAKERKRQDRFNGLSEEEVAQRTLPDHLAPNLDIIIVGINPGMFAAYKGHHYAGPGNHFWKCLYLSGLVPEPFSADDDFSLLNYGIGFTNMVARPTKGSADLTRREIKQGSQILLEKLQKFRPKIAVFNGKLIYEVFSGKKDFPFGRQSEFVDGTNTYIWVMPSSSARCAQLPRAADKVPFYMALKKFRDYLNGLISEIDESEVVFHEPKSSQKSIANSPNGDVKTPPMKSDPLDEPPPNPVKKKRGRPRKGMEKNSGEPKPAKMPKPSKDDGRFGPGEGEPPRKRRGRPKKIKPEEGSSSLPLTSKSGSGPGPESSGNQQKASSVSSGYSTGTTGSNSSEDRCRREENGSLSNAGSTGLSPSHHSFTTQSDLSSEISAAISCGSCPPSPLNNTGNSNSTANASSNQSETVFDTLSTMSQGRSHDLNHTKQHPNSNPIQHRNGGSHGQESPNNSNGSNPYQSSPSVGNPMESHAAHDQASYHHYQQSQYDNRFHHVSNRSQQQQQPTYHPSSSRDPEPPPMQTPPASYPTSQAQTSYEQKCLDITTKSLSGLESLVDQIPSIGEAEGGGGGGGAVVSHMGSVGHDPQGMSAQITSSSHFGESSSTPGSGFLPYGHHVPATSYATASHYASSAPYYASELSSTFPPVNSLSSAYPPFGYAPYYGNQGGGYPGNPGSYPSPASAYSPPNPYMNSMNSPSAQRYPQRPFHLRQDGMDLGSLGFGGY